jgi:phenylacetyl-CoA:acceptor oxidoreductase
VSILLGKSVNNGWGGYHACWARAVLAILVGSLEVPGGTIGPAVLKLNEPGDDRIKSIAPGPDGFMEFPFNPTAKGEWEAQPSIRNAYRMLVPLSANSPRSAALGPTFLPWIFQHKPVPGVPRQTHPGVWFTYRTNPAISMWNAPKVAELIAEFPFIVSFAYTIDETNHMADVLLPEATDLESLQLIRIGGSQFMEQFWHARGWAIRQPVVSPAADCRDITDIASELAQRTGIAARYFEIINNGRLGIPLRGSSYDYSLDPGGSHNCEEIWDAVAQAASHEISGGAEVRDLAWFKENGFMLRPAAQRDWYLYPALKRRGLRFELPYQERLKRHGAQLRNRLHESGIHWWDRQLAEYEPLPAYVSFPSIWVEHARDAGASPDRFPLWAISTRSMQFAWGANVTLPLMHEAAENVAGHKGIMMNRSTARHLGIAEGDRVTIESPTGRTSGVAELREGIRPDTVVLLGQFDHWATPVARDLHRPSLNSVTDLALSLTDSSGSGADLARVRIYKAPASGA